MATATTVRERPILFSGPMVKALLDGRKTQTRRIAKPPTKAVFLPGDRWMDDEDEPGTAYFDDGSGRLYIHCPYGKPGDRLWVRESFYVAEPYSWGTYPSGEPIEFKGVPRRPIHYKADGPPANVPNSHYPKGLSGGKFAAPDPDAIWVARPSIHMPRWASRITLEITEVRVERLQEISEADAKAEGLVEWTDPPRTPTKHYGISVPDVWETDPRMAYARLWESINGHGSWDANPWVWVVEFRRIGQGIDA